MRATTTLDHRDLRSGAYVIRQTRHSRWRGVVTIDWKRFQILVDDPRRGTLGSWDVENLSRDGWSRAMSMAIRARIIPPHELERMGTLERLGTVEWEGRKHLHTLQIARIVERELLLDDLPDHVLHRGHKFDLWRGIAEDVEGTF